MTTLAWKSRASRLAVILSSAAVLLPMDGCRSKGSSVPAIEFTHVPEANAGGPERLDFIEGRVHGAAPGQQVVLYAHSGIWWVQPFANGPITKILPDETWKNSTHLGTEYAALLVDSTYRPATRMAALPGVGNGVAAVAIVKGSLAAPVTVKTIRFSGYDWAVRTAGSDRGGEPNDYDSDNAWTDERGFLHLRMADRRGKWSCAEVALTRSLGYGTYHFVVQDASHLNPSTVVGLFTWDDLHSEGFRNELDVELSQWGNPKWENAQYVVQPFYVPENVDRFAAPAGVVSHVIRWETNRVAFQTFRGPAIGSGLKPAKEHVFTSGIPAPATETVHMDIYEFHHSRNSSHQPDEVVIEKFEYLP